MDSHAGCLPNQSPSQEAGPELCASCVPCLWPSTGQVEHTTLLLDLEGQESLPATVTLRSGSQTCVICRIHKAEH